MTAGDARRVAPAGDCVMAGDADQNELVLIRLIKDGTPKYFTVVLLDMEMQMFVA